MAAIYILRPYENMEDGHDALQHFEWAMERFSVMSGRNPQAKTALGVMRAIYVRFKKALDSSSVKGAPGGGHLTPIVQRASSITGRSPQVQEEGSPLSSSQPPVHNSHQTISTNNFTSTEISTQLTASNPLELTPALSSAWEAFSGHVQIPSDFRFSSIEPLLPMHDLLYNDLGTLDRDLQVLDTTGGMDDIRGPKMWQFEGDFGNDSFWSFMNSYGP